MTCSERKPSLLMMSGWQSISTASLMTHSIHLDFLFRMLLVLWNWMQ